MSEVKNPFELLADFETHAALCSLDEIARGRVLVPSQAASIAATMEKYPDRFRELVIDSEEALAELHDTLLSPAEYVFGFGISGEVTESD